MKYDGILNIAHRGASGIERENTMAAFRAAVRLGCDGIETDVQLSSDGVPVLIHDETLDRTTSATGLVQDRTFAELLALGVPSLRELLELAVASGLVLNLELKNGEIEYPGLEEKTLALVREYGFSDSIILSTFNHRSAVRCKELAPDIAVGLLYPNQLYRPARYCESLGCDALHPYFRAINLDEVAEAHSLGIRVNPWTVNEVPDIDDAIALGVDAIISNFPDRVRERLLKKKI